MENGDLFSSTEQANFNHRGKCKKLINTVDENRRQRGRPRIYKTKEERKRANRDWMRAFRKHKKKLIHFKSNSVEWSTPEDLFQVLNEEFHFTLDVCADASNAKCQAYFTKEQDGLRQRWQGTCWMNPPYGSEIPRWVQKAFESSLFGTTVVCLLPARTDTRWWQYYVRPLPSEDIDFLPGRQRFSEQGSAPFPSAVVIFRPRRG